ncbi:MAG TPA: cytochrome c [Gemmataceae bacterium]|nr:cytochrome c [Gemmataceae bacterium]
MKRRSAILFVGSMLALAFWSMTAYSQPNNPKQAQQDVLKLVKSMNGNKGNVKAQTAAMKKKYNLEDIMWFYKPRKKGGIGFGKDGDSIELTIGKVGNPRAKGWTPKKRLAMRADLAKVAEFNRAIAEVADLYANEFNDSKGKKNPALWKKFVKEMRKGADDLDKAAKGQNAGAIQKAADNLNASCIKCHSEFRE